MDKKLIEKLNKRIEEGTLRSLSSFEGFVDFFSNDYLGLAKIPFSSELSAGYGSTGSRLISGTNSLNLNVEKNLATFFEAESALIYNSGYDANVGFFSCVPQRGDTVLFDECIHASVRDGIRLSFAHSSSFKHNNVADLIQKMDAARGTVYVAVESLYSMDGDFAPLKEIASACTNKGAYLVVDEAHAGGVFGSDGKGLVIAENSNDFVFARLVTFGKAYGGHGGLVLGCQDLVNYLVNFSRSFIYTTALPAESYARMTKVVGFSGNEQLRKALHANVSFFRKLMQEYQFVSNAESPIQMLKIGDVERTKKIAEMLQANKIAVKPIFSPTVAQGEEGLRICIHAFNTTEQIEKLVVLIQNF